MKAIFVLAIILALTCSPEKDIQVIANRWVLVKKIDAYRHNGNYFLWLQWKDERGQIFSEFVPSSDDYKYPIGMVTVNRDRK